MNATESCDKSLGPQRVVVTLALIAITFHWIDSYWHFETKVFFDILGKEWSYCTSLLVLALLLTIWLPRQFGLGLANTGSHLAVVLTVAGGMIGVCLVVMLFVRTPFYRGTSSIYLVVPLAEELLFRGFLFTVVGCVFPGSLRVGGKSMPWTVLITAVAFSAWHLGGMRLPTGGFIWFQLLYTGVAGLLWGILRARTGSLWSGWFIHATINAWAVHVPGFWFVV